MVDTTYSKHDLRNPYNFIHPKGKGERRETLETGLESTGGGKQESGKIQWEVKAWKKIKTFCNIASTFKPENAGKCKKRQGKDGTSW